MRKVIKRIGNSLGIILSKEEIKIYKFDIGGIVYFTITKVIKNKEVKNVRKK